MPVPAGIKRPTITFSLRPVKVSIFPTVAASDTITLNGGTTGGIVGDYLEIVDIATDKYHVRGVMRVAAGANPATPFSATVS